MYLVGTTIALLCFVGGFFVPMYGAGVIERRNIREYEDAARLAELAGYKGYADELIGNSVGKNTNVKQIDASQARGIEVIQIIYNRLDLAPEEAAFPSCRRQDLGVFARVPLASGYLSGKYKPGATFAAGDVRSKQDAEQRDAKLREVERIRQQELPPGTGMATWALAWCLQHPAVTAVIPGCKDVKQVESNACAADLDLVRNFHLLVGGRHAGAQPGAQVDRVGLAQRDDRGVEDRAVGQHDLLLALLQDGVEQAQRGHHALVRAAQRARLEAHALADPEGPRAEQDGAGEQVAERLLRRETEDDRGEGGGGEQSRGVGPGDAEGDHDRDHDRDEANEEADGAGGPGIHPPEESRRRRSAHVAGDRPA